MRREDKMIRFAPHARERMAARGISDLQATMALLAPDVVRPARTPDARRFEKQISVRRRLVVIAVESPDAFRVISAWYA